MTKNNVLLHESGIKLLSFRVNVDIRTYTLTKWIKGGNEESC